MIRTIRFAEQRWIGAKMPIQMANLISARRAAWKSWSCSWRRMKTFTIKPLKMFSMMKSSIQHSGCTGAPCLPSKTGIAHWKWSCISRDLFIILPVCRISVLWNLQDTISMNLWSCQCRNILKMLGLISSLIQKWRMLFSSLRMERRLRLWSSAKSMARKTALCWQKTTLYLLQTAAVQRERFTAIRIMRRMVMRKSEQAVSGASGKILPDRTRPSDIRRNSAQMWPRQTGSPQLSQHWMIRLFLILPTSANVIREQAMSLQEASSAVRIPVGFWAGPLTDRDSLKSRTKIKSAYGCMVCLQMYRVILLRNRWRIVQVRKSQQNGCIIWVYRKIRLWIWQKTVLFAYRPWCLISLHSLCREQKVTDRMLSRMAAWTLHSSDSSQTHREIRFSPQNILYVQRWKPCMDCWV